MYFYRRPINLLTIILVAIILFILSIVTKLFKQNNDIHQSGTESHYTLKYQYKGFKKVIRTKR